MIDFRADIHCHSNFSDGTDTPFELLHLAKKMGLQGLSITDHDTIDAYSDDFFLEAKKLNLQILSGIEISSELDGMSVHILGYGIDLQSIELKNFLVEMQKRRSIRNLAILEKLKMKKMVITEEELKSLTHRTVGRPHIAQLMVKKGYVQSTRDAFEFYLKEGSSCYASGIKYTPMDVINQIHQAKGKAILAHPHFIKKGAFLRKLLRLPFDGIECYYARLASSLEAPWIKLAAENNWIATGGSDYHGHFKPHITLGVSWVNKETFDLLSKEELGN